jgi:hypothetical protein
MCDCKEGMMDGRPKIQHVPLIQGQKTEQDRTIVQYVCGILTSPTFKISQAFEESPLDIRLDVGRATMRSRTPYDYSMGLWKVARILPVIKCALTVLAWFTTRIMSAAIYISLAWALGVHYFVMISFTMVAHK